MKTTTVRSTITACLITITSWLATGTSDARPSCAYKPPSQNIVSGHCHCGRPNYVERYFIGYDRCGRPLWDYRPVWQHRHPVIRAPRCQPMPPPCDRYAPQHRGRVRLIWEGGFNL